MGALVSAKIGVRAKCGEPKNWFSAAPLKFDPKPSEAIYAAILSNFEKCRPEVADNVIADVAVDSAWMSV